MKITIIEDSRHAKTCGNFWSSTGGCFFRHACSVCPFYPYTAGKPCSMLRDRFIAAVAATTLPHTFDTDYYPELLI